MGEYTSVIEFNLCTEFPEQLKAWLESVKNMKIDEKNDVLSEYKYWADKVKVAEDKSSNNFYDVEIDMDDHKIIEYWYDGFVLFLRDLAVFIVDDCRIELDCTTDSKANLHFQDGKVQIEIGTINWMTETPESLCRKPVEQSEELKKLLLARSI